MKRDFALMGVGSLVAQGLAVLGFLLIARTLGPQQFGLGMAAIGAGTFLSLVVNGGVAPYVTRGVATASLAPPHVAALLGERLTLSVAAATVLSVSVYLLQSPPVWLSLLYGAWFMALSYGQLLQTELRAKKRFGVVSLVLTADKGVFLASAAVGMALSDNAVVLPVALGAGALAGIAVGHMCRASLLIPHVPKVSSQKAVAQYQSTAILIGLQGLDVTVGPAAVGATNTGMYSSVARWGQPLALVVSTASQVALPRFSEGDGSDSRGVLYRTLPLGAGVSVLALGCGLSAPYLVPLLLGEQFGHAVLALQLVMCGSACAAISQLLTNYILARGAAGSSRRVMWGGVAAQYGTLAIGSRYFPHVALPLALLTSQTVILVGMARAVARLRFEELKQNPRA